MFAKIEYKNLNVQNLHEKLEVTMKKSLKGFFGSSQNVISVNMKRLNNHKPFVRAARPPMLIRE